MGAPEQTDAFRLRQHLYDTRAEAECLRLDLGDATALIEALEAELWSVTGRWDGPAHDQRQPGSDPLSLLIQARTQLRRTLFQELGSYVTPPAALADLRLAEVSFRFLLGLRSVRADRRSG